MIQSKVDFYEVCASLFQTIFYYYYFYTNNSFPSAIFVASLNLGERRLGSIDQEASSCRDTRIKISFGGQDC